MKEQHIIVNGLNIAYTEYGKACNKPSMVLIHGWLDNAASFKQLIPHLNHPHIIAIDLVGHGLSDHLPSCAYYHFIDGVSQLVELLHALKIKRAILLAHSLGACLASILAGSAPNMVEKLILLDAIGPLTSPAHESAQKYQMYLKQFLVLSKKPKRIYQTIEDACHHRGLNGYLSADLVVDIVKRGLKISENGFEWRHDPRLLLPSPLRMTENQTLAFLQEIQAPTLIINASNGFKIDENRYQARLEKVANLQHCTLECGHHLHIEQPTACALLINRFLKSSI